MAASFDTYGFLLDCTVYDMDDLHVMPHGNSALRSVERQLVESVKPFVPTGPLYSLFSFYSLLNLAHTRIGKYLPMGYGLRCLHVN